MLKISKLSILTLFFMFTANISVAGAYTEQDVNRLQDFAAIIGGSVACEVSVEEDIKLVVYWAAATFGDDTDKYMAAFQKNLDQVTAKSIAAAKRTEGVPCSQTREMRAAAIEYLRAALYLYKLEGKLPKQAELPEGRLEPPSGLNNYVPGE